MHVYSTSIPEFFHAQCMQSISEMGNSKHSTHFAYKEFTLKYITTVFEKEKEKFSFQNLLFFIQNGVTNPSHTVLNKKVKISDSCSYSIGVRKLKGCNTNTSFLY